MCGDCQHCDNRHEYKADAPAGYVGRTRVDLGPNDEIGTCRRWPPLASINAVTVWPVVRADEWCSQWKASEEPVYKARKPGRIGR